LRATTPAKAISQSDLGRLLALTNKGQTGVAETETPDRIESERAADSKADVWSAFVVFSMLVLGAIHFVSGWTFDV
jgi:hypothetical protein